MGYELETTCLGLLTLYGQEAREDLERGGWAPELCRRPQIRAVSRWILDRLDAGESCEMVALMAALERGDGPLDWPEKELKMLLIQAPNSVPPLQATQRVAREFKQGWIYQRTQQLQKQLTDAVQKNDGPSIARISRQLTELVAPQAPRKASTRNDPCEGDTPDMEVVSRLRRLGKAKKDARVLTEEVLKNDARWKGKIWYDQMRGRQMLDEKPWSDADDTRIGLWLSRVYGVKASTSQVREVAATIAQDFARHPLQDYLRALSWDGQSRLDSWLCHGLGVADSPLVRAIARKWLVQAVARALRPGCQADAVLVLVGRQGIYKSSALRALAGDAFFSESPIDLHGDMVRAQEQVHSAWIHDLSEGTDVRRADVDRLKQFLTTREDNYMGKYRKNNELRKRSAVFASTTNDQRFLPDDPSGARRFWPVACTEGDIAWIKANRDRLWAEAVFRFEQNEAWYLAQPEAEQLLEHQADYQQDDSLTARVKRWLHLTETSNSLWLDDQPRDGRELLTTERLMMGPMGLDEKDLLVRRNEQKAGDILRKLGFERQRIRTGKELEWAYRPQRGRAENQP